MISLKATRGALKESFLPEEAAASNQGSVSGKSIAPSSK
jgi:hypothetical protein